MTDSLFFDSDCISAFLWVREQNLFKDIALYIDELKLKHITTGDILIEALEKGFITETEGNNIWASMIAKRRKLGAGSFTEYLFTNRGRP